MSVVAEGVLTVLLAAGPSPSAGPDCEMLGDGVLAQPVAALTSLAYVAAGAVLLWRWRTLTLPRRRWAMLYAGLLALVGVGSVVYHGPGGSLAGVLHDLPIVALLAQAVLVPVARAVRGRPVLVGLSRHDLVTLGLVAVLAGAAYVLGRTGSPACDPEALLQLHGAWHIASAVALSLWGCLLYRGGA